MDLAKLTAAVSRIETDNGSVISVLTAVRDENRTLQNEVTDLSARLAAIPGDTAALEQQLNDIATRLGASADTVEAAVANNPNIENLPPDTNAPAPAAGDTGS